MSETSLGIRVRDVLAIARTRDASDVHLEPSQPPIVRVDGVLERLAEHPVEAEELQAISDRVLDARARETLVQSGDVSVGLRAERLGALRAHFYRSDRGLTLALRLLRASVPPLNSLGLPPIVESFCEAAHGLVMFTGPTGCGKSTTMASAVDHINLHRARRIISIEDPIEYRYESRRSLITQREIGRDTCSLSAGIVGALRSDPDVIVVGEMREGGAIEAALNAAETGHLVFATLHTGDAAQTVDRVAGAFSGALGVQVRAQLAQSLVAVVTQRLVARKDGRGRRAIAEILVATEAARNLIRESKTHHLRNVIATGREFGMLTFDQHRAELQARGEVLPGVA